MELIDAKNLCIYTNDSQISLQQTNLVVNFLSAQKIAFEVKDVTNDFKTLGAMIAILPEYRRTPGAKITFPQLVLNPVKLELPKMLNENNRAFTDRHHAIYLGSFLEFRTAVCSGKTKSDDILQFLKVKKISLMYDKMIVDKNAVEKFVMGYNDLENQPCYKFEEIEIPEELENGKTVDGPIGQLEKEKRDLARVSR